MLISKEEKVNIVQSPDQREFLIRAQSTMLKVLCVSRYTVYNYLDEIREIINSKGRIDYIQRNCKTEKAPEAIGPYSKP